MNSFIRANKPFAPVRLPRNLSVRVFVFALLFGLSATFAADVVITSEQKGADVIPLGFVDFPCTKGAPPAYQQSPDSVLANDLRFSGRFRLDRSVLLDTLSKAQFKQDSALAYLQGKYAFDDGKFMLQCELDDINSGQPILNKVYSGPANQLRSAAHQFADELVYQLFGEKGIAQTRIAYVKKRGAGKEIYVMDYDGVNSHQVTHNGSINLGPIFLGAQDKILFTSFAAGVPKFFLADLTAGGNPKLVYPSKGMNSASSYDPLDKEIAYASSVDGNSEIFRRPVDGGKATRLTFSESIETSPSWSPNGYEIVFMSDRSGQPMLYVMDRDGSNTRRITYDYNYCGGPAWSPKGDRIAFAAMDEGNNFNIYTISPDGSNPVKLTTGAGSNEHPSWSPDGRHLVFMSTRTGSPEIFVMDADGKNVTRISYSGGNSMPSWSGY